ncbi:MAG TPA: efflux RND transporter periplasmic adaptor subunit [Candidatus Hydrogenedentes bacterium]|nr:efflux RND transporter periplasmic adaptor subunit [Candidatus Hydrogenedentota bacterium]HOL75416.1 efflux RND transporter periplasmic adaptor subunit [Candidatus Hydrogenedentota bacterium]HPO84925.1 efflux RND transporter periplasmic adaptor subunit [Candidatus Hydrogenedentota bacterium]
MPRFRFAFAKSKLFWFFGFLLVFSIFGFVGKGLTGKTNASQPPESAVSSIPVVLEPVQKRQFENRVVVQANVKAKDYVAVPALVGGTIKKLYVDEGDTVVAGETKLFESDPLKFEKLVQIRKQEFVLAGCTRREQEANLERVRADYEKAKADVERFRKLRAKGAVSEDALEQQESRFKQLTAVVKQAETALQSGAELETQAKAALAIAEKDLRDCTVYAPISGKVSRIIVEEGEMGELGKPVLRIDDPSVVEISALLPAEYYDLVTPGETKIKLQVYHTDLGEQVISYKSPVIDPRLRTFEVKTVLTNPPPTVVPGAIAQSTIVLEQHEGLGIPAKAIQTRAGRFVVFTVENNVARKLTIEKGLETDGWVEILGDQVSEGMPLVVMGQFLLDDGTPVTIQENAA